MSEDWEGQGMALLARHCHGNPRTIPKLVPHALCETSEDRAGRKAGWWSGIPQTLSWLLPGQFHDRPDPAPSEHRSLPMSALWAGYAFDAQAASSCQRQTMGWVNAECARRVLRPPQAPKAYPGQPAGPGVCSCNETLWSQGNGPQRRRSNAGAQHHRQLL